MRPSELNIFDPFSDLDEHNKIVAARVLEKHHLKSGDKLFDVGDNDAEEHFLLAGEIELSAQDGVKKRIKAGESAAKFPLALLRPRKFTATVLSASAEVLCIDLEVLQELRHTIPAVGDGAAAFAPTTMLSGLSKSVESNPGDTLKKFAQGARHAILENRLPIGNFDEVSTVIFNTLQSKDICMDTLTSAVQLDPAISAKLLKVANSPFFLGLSKVDSVRTAIVRLGLDTTKELVMMMVLKEVFSSRIETLQAAMHHAWLSSLKLATYCVVIGKRSNLRVSQGQTLLAGLMDEIGTLVTIVYLDQFPGVAENMSSALLSSQSLNKTLGKVLLEHWDFPSTICNSVEYSDDWRRQIESPDLCDIVCLAKVMVRMSSYRKLPISSLTEVSAYTRLGFENDSDHFMHEVMEESGRYLQLFMGVFE